MNPVEIALNTLVAADSLVGWNLSGGVAAATVNLRYKKAEEADPDNSGDLIATISVGANETDTIVFGGRMISALGGIYVEDIAGTMAGALFVS